MNNLKEAKELLDKYKGITLAQLEEAYKNKSRLSGIDFLDEITGFNIYNISYILCTPVFGVCKHCIYSFRLNEKSIPCMDIIYNEMCSANTAEELFVAIQKRINYLTHVIQYWEQL